MVKRSVSVTTGRMSPKLLISILAVLVIFAIFPLGVPRFYTYILAMIITTGLLSTSMNLVLGYGGIYQFHHAVFYGVGAYGAAVCITRLGYSPWISFIIGPVVAAILSLVMGLICVRLSKLYFGMLQVSLGSLVWMVVQRWYSFTGGDDGIHGVSMPGIISSSLGSYYFTVIVGGLAFLLIYIILRSPFGSTLQGMRDNIVRSQAIGVNVRLHQLVALVLAGFFGGVAGVMFVVVDGSVFPDMLFWHLSMEITIMALLGGWHTFFGPLLGAAIIILLRTFVSGYTEYWTLMLGIILMLVIIFLPEGVLGYTLKRLRGKGKPGMAGESRLGMAGEEA
jgi:branched-chain amino acid transport system permease protein